MRRAAKTDTNQQQIVADLRTIPGVSVEADHHDLLVGFRGYTFWYEIKNADAVSKKTGKIKESSKRDSQKVLDKTWTGHREYATTTEEILTDITNRTTNR